MTSTWSDSQTHHSDTSSTASPYAAEPQQLRLRNSNGSNDTTRRYSTRASQHIPHRLSSSELVELEEQLLQQQQYINASNLPVNDPQEEDASDDDLLGWNPNASSPSDDDDIDEDEDDDEDDEQAQLSSMSDTDDSVDSGNVMRNDVTCGVVEDALLQLSEYVDPNAAAVAMDVDQNQYKKTLSSLQRISSMIDTTNGSHYPSSSAPDVYLKNDDDYSPKMKTNGSPAISATTTASHHHHHSKKRRFLLSRFRRHKKQDTVPAVFDFEQYMLKREMSVTQEKWNALTVLPNPMYCLYFILSAQWFYQNSTTTSSSSHWSADAAGNDYSHPWSTLDVGGAVDGDDAGCLSPSTWHSMPVLPPLPVLAVVLGICVHAPWSFLYHWTFAHTMSATQRTKHWSRRMDQSFIHVASSFMCYGTSGNLQFFLINTLYNLDCIRRQFRPTVRPKQNQMRIILSIIAYTLPLLKHREYNNFLQLWVLFSISGYFFIQYPVGGWSHAVFHIVIAFVPPLLLRTATALPSSQAQLYRAAMCAATTAAAGVSSTGHGSGW